MKQRIIGIITGLISALVLAASSTSVSALNLFGRDIPQPQQAVAASLGSLQNDLNSQCLQFTNHEYEVCVAYVVNASLADLVPYYAFVHSPNSALSRFLAYRLGSRYTGQAQDTIQNRVSSWPTGNMVVSIPDIKILAVTPSLATNSATLITQETWKVSSSSGEVLFQETNTPHTIGMQRVPSYLLHKWIVTDIH
jgi:hypothetical protein